MLLLIDSNRTIGIITTSMKIGTVTKANKKGQLVIPKKIRDELEIKQGTLLNIVQRGEGGYIYPIRAVFTKAEEEESYS